MRDDMRGSRWSWVVVWLLPVVGCGATSRNAGEGGGGGEGGRGGSAEAGAAGVSGASGIAGRYAGELLPAALPAGPSCTYGAEPVELRRMCGEALCGNGKVDSCMTIGGGACETSPGCMMVEVSESCDGADLSGNTCEALGYSGGALRCTTCALDESDCSVCSNDPRVVQCGELRTADVARETWSAKLGPRGDEVGLLWLENRGVRFARLSPSLEVLSSSDCFAGHGSNTTVGESLALAATETGWLAASVLLAEQVQLHVIDASGNVVASHDVGSPSEVPRALLSPSEHGGALLVTNQEVVLLSADGEELASSAPFPEDELESLALARVGRGFLVAGQFSTATERYIQTWQVDEAGVVTAAPAPLATGAAGPYQVRLVGFDDRALAFWSDNPGVSASWLDVAGVPTEPLALAPELGLPEVARWGEGVALRYGSVSGEVALRYLHADGTLDDASVPIVVGKRWTGPAEMRELPSGELLLTLVNSKQGAYGHRLFARVAPPVAATSPGSL